jgi:hypothetical protein
MKKITREYIEGEGGKLFRDTWKYGTTKQKSRLLKTRGLHSSWAKTKSPDEMVRRGGGLAVSSLGRVFDEYLKRNKSRRITWG